MSSTPHIKPLPPEAGSPPDVATPSRPRGHGWVVFAALMLFMAGYGACAPTRPQSRPEGCGNHARVRIA
jgi:hypothetical protein